jgi:hypothetical protein
LRGYGILVATLLLVLCVPIIGTAQAPISLESIDDLNLGAVRVTPSVKAVYQQMGVNINLPVPFSGIAGFELFSSSGLDFKLQDAGVWVGGVRVDARLGRWSVFATAEGNATKSVRVSTPSDPFWGGIYPVNWRGSNLEWWSVGGGGAINIKSDFAVVGGFKAEHLSLGLADPVDPTGIIRQFQATFGDLYTSDFLTKLYVPYFGFSLGGPNYTGTLIFSPYTWADVKIPFRYLFLSAPQLLAGFEEARYAFQRGGILLEGSFDYRVQASANAFCALWFKGSCCQIRGRGYEYYQSIGTVAGNPNFSFSNSGSADGSFGQYVLAGGISLQCAF